MSSYGSRKRSRNRRKGNAPKPQQRQTSRPHMKSVQPLPKSREISDGVLVTSNSEKPGVGPLSPTDKETLVYVVLGAAAFLSVTHIIPWILNLNWG